MANNLFTNLLKNFKNKQKMQASIEWFKALINALSGKKSIPPEIMGDVPFVDPGNERRKAIVSRNLSTGKVTPVGPAASTNPQNKQFGKYTFKSRMTADSIGKLYMFSYDPKHKDTLPYYDTFPMVFPFGVYSDRFIGINMHYLPPVLRSKLMDALYDTLVTEKGEKKLALDYQILKSVSKYRYFKPCIKEYLYSQVRQQFLEIDYQYWDYALLLQLENFKKATKEKVWEDSANSFK